MEYYKDVLNKYAVFTGRASRRQYWMFVLFNFIFSIALSIIDGMFGFKGAYGMGVLSTIYALALLVPSIAVGVRRLQDTNRSGWWTLIALIPFVGVIVLIVFLCLESTPGSNKYGPQVSDKVTHVDATPVPNTPVPTDTPTTSA